MSVHRPCAAGLLILLLGGMLLAGCSHTPWKPRLIILVILEACRADHLGCYGYFRATSPNLDRLAANGVLFENAFAQSNTTLFSSLSLMTGRYPERFGRLDFSTFHLPAGAPTIASALHSYGFRTGGFVGGGHWSHEYGLGPGFDVYNDVFQFGSLYNVFPPAVHWLAALPKDAPAFMLLQGYDMHAPYDKPLFFDHLFNRGYRGVIDRIGSLPDGVMEIYDGDYFIARPALQEHKTARGHPVLMSGYYDLLQQMKKGNAPHLKLTPADVDHLIALYDGSIRYADVYVGLLTAQIHRLGLERQTLLIVAGDIGEGLMHNSFFDHQGYLADDETHVPLIVWGPGGIPAGRRVSQVTQLIDLAPTIYDYALSSPRSLMPSFDGKSLRPLIAGSAPAGPAAAAFSEGVRPMISVRTLTRRLLCFRTSRQPIPPLDATDCRYWEVHHGIERDRPVRGPQAQALWRRLRAWAARVAGLH